MENGVRCEVTEKTNYICEYCKHIGEPSTFVFIDSSRKYGLCTTCANKMKNNRHAYIVRGNEIRCQD